MKKEFKFLLKQQSQETLFKIRSCTQWKEKKRIKRSLTLGCELQNNHQAAHIGNTLLTS